MAIDKLLRLLKVLFKKQIHKTVAKSFCYQEDSATVFYKDFLHVDSDGYAEGSVQAMANYQHLHGESYKNRILHKALSAELLAEAVQQIDIENRWIVGQGFGPLKRKFRLTCACYEVQLRLRQG